MTTMTTMTMKQFLTAVAETTTRPELAEYALTELHKLEARKAKRRATPTKVQLAFAKTVMEYAKKVPEGTIVTAPLTARELGVTTQKATAVLLKGVTMGYFTEGEPVKTKGTKVKGYVRVITA